MLWALECRFQAFESALTACLWRRLCLSVDSESLIVGVTSLRVQDLSATQCFDTKCNTTTKAHRPTKCATKQPSLSTNPSLFITDRLSRVISYKAMNVSCQKFSRGCVRCWRITVRPQVQAAALKLVLVLVPATSTYGLWWWLSTPSSPGHTGRITPWQLLPRLPAPQHRKNSGEALSI